MLMVGLEFVVGEKREMHEGCWILLNVNERDKCNLMGVGRKKIVEELVGGCWYVGVVM